MAVVVVEIETDGGSDGDQPLAALVNCLWSWSMLVVVVVSIVVLMVMGMQDVDQ